jgi:MFS family permease
MRVLITGYFLLDGFVFANWVVRVPQIKAHVGASAGMLGLALLGVSAGAIATMTITGRLCRRFGPRVVTLATAVLLSGSVALPALTSTVAGLGAALLLFGAGWGGMNVAINSAAVDIIGELDRPIMPSFHAAYSLGGLLGSAVGGILADHVGAPGHLAAVGGACLAASIALGVALLRCPPLAVDLRHAAALDTAEVGGQAGGQPAPLARESGTARQVTTVLYIFSIIVLCSSYGEGAMADWGALHLRTDLGTSAGLAAAGFASFSIAMFVGRLSGSWVLRRIGRTAVLAGGCLMAGAGMLAAALLPSLPVALIGFVLVGLGLSNAFPTTIGQAGVLRGPAGVATASTFGYSGFLTGPPLIGFLADRFGLPIALTSISALAAIAAGIALLTARQVRHAETFSRGEPATALAS